MLPTAIARVRPFWYFTSNRIGYILSSFLFHRIAQNTGGKLRCRPGDRSKFEWKTFATASVTSVASVVTANGAASTNVDRHIFLMRSFYRDPRQRVGVNLPVSLGKKTHHRWDAAERSKRARTNKRTAELVRTMTPAVGASRSFCGWLSQCEWLWYYPKRRSTLTSAPIARWVRHRFRYEQAHGQTYVSPLPRYGPIVT